jgi:ribosomal protein S18 acetylase RimI-like enzyme
MTTETSSSVIVIREATANDFDSIWLFFEAIARAGETYAYARDIDKESAFSLWLEQPRITLVAEFEGRIVGSYYIKTNNQGPGSHVCNCGYMVADEARGRGVAREMCLHSQTLARQLGYRAMQFNFVASSNVAAVALWTKLGFATVGVLPLAFEHPVVGFVDALVMHKPLV